MRVGYYDGNDNFNFTLNGENIDINYDKSSFIICLLVIFLWINEEQLIDFYNLALKDLDFWMFELLIITLFHKKIFKIEIYKHQKLAILINIIPCFLKIIAIILGFNHELATYHILYTINL